MRHSTAQRDMGVKLDLNQSFAAERIPLASADHSIIDELA